MIAGIHFDTTSDVVAENDVSESTPPTTDPTTHPPTHPSTNRCCMGGNVTAGAKTRVGERSRTAWD